MTPFRTIAIFDFDGSRHLLSLSGHASLIDRERNNETLIFNPGLLKVGVPGRIIDMVEASNSLSGTARVEVSFSSLDLWTISREGTVPQRGTVTIYAQVNEEYLQDCTMLYSGVMGPVKYNHNKGSWTASVHPKIMNVDTLFPPISTDETERYGILGWPCLGARAIESNRGAYDYPGAVTSVLNNAKQNADEALPVIYGTVYDASVPVLQARLITWNHPAGEPQESIYSTVAYDVGIACHPIVGTSRYKASDSEVLIMADAFGVGGALTDIKGWVDINQDGYIVPNEFTYGTPADTDHNEKNRKKPTPFYYKFDKKGQLTVVAAARPPAKGTEIATPGWVDIDMVQGEANPHPAPDPDDPGHFDSFKVYMPDIDTGTWNIPVLTGKPSGHGALPIERLGDVLLDLWRSFARQGLKDLDLKRITAAIPALNKYTVGMLFNSKPKTVTLTRILASRVAPQFPIAFGAPAGVWGFDGVEFPSKSDPPIRSFSYPDNLFDRAEVRETDKRKIRNRFIVKYKYSGWRGETTEEASVDESNNKSCYVSEMTWGRSPIHEIEAPDISDSRTATLVATEWARRLTKVRIRYTYKTYDTSVLDIPPSSHVLLSDAEIGLEKASVCYEGCTIDPVRGLITIQLLSIDGT